MRGFGSFGALSTLFCSVLVVSPAGEHQHQQDLDHFHDHGPEVGCGGCGNSFSEEKKAALAELGHTFGSTTLVEMNQAAMAGEIAHAVPEDGGTGNLYGDNIDVLYMRINFQDDLTEYQTVESAHKMMDDVAAWYHEASYGQVQIRTTVTPLLTMPRAWREYDEWPGHLDDANAGTRPLALEASAMAKAAGYDPANYDIITVRHRGSIFGGWAGLGGGGITWLKASSVDVQIHELGHAIGLPHSSSWQNQNRSTLGARFAGDGFSWSSHVAAYGSPWDIMGSGSHDFLPEHKFNLGWLRGDRVTDAVSNGRYRVYAFDYHRLDGDKTYALRIERNKQQTYWAGIRYHDFNTPSNFSEKSLLLWEKPWDSSRALGANDRDSVPTLLDANPGSAYGFNDAGIILGQTYHDMPADLYITVVDAVETTPIALDVVVNQGPFPENNPPTVTLTVAGDDVDKIGDTGQVLVAPLDTITFQATATDPDGDELAYFWEFDDGGQYTQNSSTIDYTFNESGLRTARLIVSDMKGGTATALMRVNVGLQEYPGFDVDDPNGRSEVYATGRIVDQSGEPVQGVRIWINQNLPNTNSTEKLVAFTDSDGRFIMSGIDAANNDGLEFDLFKQGWSFAGLDTASVWGSSPITLKHNDLDEVNFVAFSRQLVSIEMLIDEVTETDSEQIFDNAVRIRRTGPEVVTLADDLGYTVDNFLFTDLWVRIYTDRWESGVDRLINDTSGAEVKLQFDYPNDRDGSNDPILEPVDLKLMDELTVQNPEFPAEERKKQTFSAEGESGDTAIEFDRWVKIPAGEEYVDLRLVVSGDDASEGTEQFEFFIAFSPDYQEVNHRGVLTVIDDEPAPALQVRLDGTAGPAYEGGQFNSVATFTRLDDGLEEALTLNFGAPTGTAVEGEDYEAFPRSVIFPAGQRVLHLPIRAIEDQIIEETETIQIPLGTVSGFTWENPAAVISTSIEDRGQVQVAVASTGGPGLEPFNGGDARNATFTFFRYGNLNTSLTVAYDFVTPAAAGLTGVNSAEFNVDYQVVGDGPQEVTFLPGETAKSVSIEPTEDAEIEGTEYAVISVLPRTTYNIATNPYAYTTIGDTGTVPLVWISSSPRNINEGGETTITFRRNGVAEALEKELVIYFGLSGDADPGFDYTIDTQVSGQVLFRADETEAQVTVIASNDGVDEGTSEEFILTLLDGNPNNPGATATYFLSEPNDNVKFTIRDQDPVSAQPMVEFETLESSVVEGGALSLEVLLSRLPGGDDRWVTDGSILRAHANIITVDYEVLVDDRAGAVQAAADVDFDAYDSVTNGLVYPRSYIPEDIDSMQTYRDIDSGTKRDDAPTQIAQGTLFFQDLGRYDKNLRTRRNAIVVATIEDLEVEGTETFIVRLKNPVNCTLPETVGAPARRETHVIHILDDDTAGTVTLTASDATAVEGGADDGEFTLTRSGMADVNDPLTVQVEVFGGATWGIDYQAIPGITLSPAGDRGSSLTGTVEFTAGVSQITLPVVLIDDDGVEAAESVRMRIVGTEPYAVYGGGTAKVSIADDLNDAASNLPVIALEAVTERVTEGESLQVRVVRSGNTAGSLTVNLVYDPRSTLGAEEVGVGSVLFLDGESSKILDIGTSDDSEPEVTEMLLAGLVASEEYVFGAGEISFRGFVFDNDNVLPQISLIASQDVFVEGGDAPGVFEITRSRDEEKSITVTVATSGSLDLNSDTSGWTLAPVVFAEGEFKRVINLYPQDDAIAEGEETLTMSIVPNAAYTINSAASSDTVTLVDDDLATVSIATLVENPIEGSSDPAFRLTRTGGDLSSSLAVDLATSGVAVAGSDFTAITGATFLADEATVDVTLATINDSAAENPESLTLTISGSASYATNAENSSSLEILDDDKARVHVAVENRRGRESLNGSPEAAVVRFYREGNSTAAVTVNFSLSGTALNAADYSDLLNVSDTVGSIVIPENAASVDLTIMPIDDTDVEVTEFVDVEILADAGYTLGAESLDENVSAEVEILSDDVPVVIVEVISTATVYDTETETAIPARLRFTRIGDSTGPLRVNYSVAGTASESVDFQTLTGFADMADGVEQVEIEVNALRAVPETLEVDVEVIASETRLGAYTPGTPVRGTVYIIGTSSPRLSIQRLDGSASMFEGTQNPARIRVERTTDLSSELTVQLVASGTATLGSDLTLEFVDADADSAGNGGSVIADIVLPVGVAAADILLQPIEDNVEEGPETYALSILDPTPANELPAYFIVGGEASVTIDDQPARSITIRIRTMEGAVVTDVEPEILSADGVLVEEGDGYRINDVSASQPTRVGISPSVSGTN